MPTKIKTELEPEQNNVVAIATADTPTTNLMVVEPVGLELTQEFQAWLEEKSAECLNYLKLSFNQELPVEKLVFHAVHLGYPDPIGQLRTHARIWGYNYKIRNEVGEFETVTNPETGKLMSYVVWQKLDPPVTPIQVADPPLESDTDTAAEDFEPEDFEAEPIGQAVA